MSIRRVMLSTLTVIGVSLFTGTGNAGSVSPSTGIADLQLQAAASGIEAVKYPGGGGKWSGGGGKWGGPRSFGGGGPRFYGGGGPKFYGGGQRLYGGGQRFYGGGQRFYGGGVRRYYGGGNPYWRRGHGRNFWYGAPFLAAPFAYYGYYNYGGGYCYWNCVNSGYDANYCSVNYADFC